MSADILTTLQDADNCILQMILMQSFFNETQNVIFLTKMSGPGKTTYAFSVTFRLACYQQAGRVWSGGKGTENTLALAENVYVVLPTPPKCLRPHFFERHTIYQ